WYATKKLANRYTRPTPGEPAAAAHRYATAPRHARPGSDPATARRPACDDPATRAAPATPDQAATPGGPRSAAPQGALVRRQRGLDRGHARVPLATKDLHRHRVAAQFAQIAHAKDLRDPQQHRQPRGLQPPRLDCLITLITAVHTRTTN